MALCFLVGILVGLLVGGLCNVAGAAAIWQSGFEAGLNAPVPPGRQAEK